MAWSVLQSNSATGSSGTPSAAYSTANLSSGTVLLAYVNCWNGTASAVRDGSSNAFAKVASVRDGSSITELSIWVLATPAGDVGTKPTISVTRTGTSFWAVLVQEVSGIQALADGTAGTASSSGTAGAVSPAYSSAAANEYLVTAYADNQPAAAAPTLNNPSGWTLDAHNVGASGNVTVDAAYKDSTGGSEADGWTAAGTGSWNEAAIMVAFQLAGGGAAAVTYAPPRTVPAAPPSPAPWAQRDRRDASTVATAANPLAAPLDTAWQASARYWHLYGDTATRDRRAYFTQRPAVSDPSLLAGAAADPLLGGGDAARHYQAATHYDRREVPQQRPYISDPSFYPAEVQVGAGTTEAWWGADTGDFYVAQRIRVSDPGLLAPPVPFDPVLGGEDDLGRRWRQAATHYDRREVPQQRPYISDPSFYPAGAVTDPLTVAWGAGGNYWHLYNRAADAADRRLVPQQRAYVSVPGLLTTALLENELLGGAGTAQRYGSAALYDRREVPQQRGPVALVTPPVPFDPLLAAWADLARRYGLAATHADRRLYPQQRLYFPVPLPPPPFTVGLLTAGDASLAVLSAAAAVAGQAVLTASDTTTGGPA